MANEITQGGSLQWSDGNTADAMSLSNIVKTAVTKLMHRAKQSIGTSEVAVNLGGISAPGYAIFRNLDPTNYVELRVASGGAKFATLDPDTNADGHGGIAVLKLGAGAQVPYAIANTAACLIEFLICST